MIKEIITLRCISCGKEFEQEVTAASEDKIAKEIKWYKRNQKQCQRCRMLRMCRGASQGPAM